MAYYDEKRKFIRMEMDTPAIIKIAGNHKEITAKCIDLSGSGIHLELTEEIKIGEKFQVTIGSNKEGLSILSASVEAVRVNPINNIFSIGASIIEMS